MQRDLLVPHSRSMISRDCCGSAKSGRADTFEGFFTMIGTVVTATPPR
jgi:hypothetical protein